MNYVRDFEVGFHASALSICFYDWMEDYIRNKYEMHALCTWDEYKNLAHEFFRCDGFNGGTPRNSEGMFYKFSVDFSLNDSLWMKEFNFDNEIYRRLSEDKVSKTIFPPAGKVFKLIATNGYLHDITIADPAVNYVFDRERNEFVDVGLDMYDKMLEEAEATLKA